MLNLTREFLSGRALRRLTLLPAFLWAAGAAFAADTAPKFADVPTAEAPIKNPAQITGLFNEILFWFSAIFWIAAVGFVFYAAYLYLTAGGDTERVKRAQKQLMYAVIAIVIGLMAQGLPALIKAFLSLGGGASAAPGVAPAAVCGGNYSSFADCVSQVGDTAYCNAVCN